MVWKRNEAQAEGRNVVLFTADDGTSYVRKDSMNTGRTSPAEEGLVFFVVGRAAPGQKLAGIPSSM